MADINRVTIIGRLTKDCEVRKTTSGISVCSFTIASDRIPTKDGNKVTDFITCIAWRQRADFLAAYGKKGSKIAVDGRIATDQYDDKKTGQRVYRTNVNVNEVELLDAKQKASTNESFDPPVINQKDETTEQYSDAPIPGIDPDDLPF